MAIKKLIEVALPLDKINEAAAKEKTIRHGHPANLHMYWARRPLAAARAVIWSSLVDDPSSHPEEFPTEEAQNKERQRLFEILEDLVLWKNVDNTEVLNAAKKEILRYTNNNPPQFLDPFAGSGAIPLEAQRLGLMTHAHDLNPVAVLINKMMIEIPSMVYGRKPINPLSRSRIDYQKQWNALEGFCEDIKYYSDYVKNEAEKKIGQLYPKQEIAKGLKTNVITWLWGRSVKCPNPLCGCDVPLISSFVLSKKKGKEFWVEPLYRDGKWRFQIRNGKYPQEYESGTKYKNANGKGKKATFCCPLCKTSVLNSEYIDKEACSGRMKYIPLAIVAEGNKGRLYFPFEEEYVQQLNNLVDSYYEKFHINEKIPREKCRGTFASNAQGGIYGFFEFKDYFTKRQLVTLSVFRDLIDDIQEIVCKDMTDAGCSCDGKNAVSELYGNAIGVCLTFIFDKMLDLSNALNRWEPNAQCPRQLFGRQAIPMIWDFAESNIFSDSSGSWNQHVKNFIDCISGKAFSFKRDYAGTAIQYNAQDKPEIDNLMISTDPPYYDNIDYSDLSDFFYVWLRPSLKKIYPEELRTTLTPKTDELIVNPYRFDGEDEKAKNFFENGMYKVCCQIRNAVRNDIPITIYYAYKQSESSNDNGHETVASNGWETMLNAIVNSGLAITGTWPIKTECGSRSVSQGSNALDSSIVLVCRKRSVDAPTTTRRNFIQELKRELKTSLQKLQSSNIAPVDMAQSAIGPGMGVFSKYAQVLEADGTPMSVRSALQIINQELDLYFNEQDGELDSNSRFCVDFYTQYGFNDAKFGEADTLARAKNTSVATLQSKGVFVAEKGVAHLVDRDKLPEKIDYADNTVWLFTQRLTHAMSMGGIKACATLIHNVHTSLPEQSKALAYRLHSIAERKGWQDEAFAYNSLVIAWTDIQMAAANIHESEDDQYKLDL